MHVWTNRSATPLGVEVLALPPLNGQKSWPRMGERRGGSCRGPLLGVGKAACAKVFTEEVN